MATFSYSSNARVSTGNEASSNGRSAIIITPDTLGEVVTPLDIENFIAGDAATLALLNTTAWLAVDSENTLIGFVQDERSRTMQLKNMYLMWGPGVTLDLEEYTIQIFDNDEPGAGTTGRSAGMQFGGAEGPNTVLTGGNAVSDAAWGNSKAVLRFRNTIYLPIKNAGGNSGDRASGPFVMALNAEVDFSEGGNVFRTGGTQNDVSAQGFGAHPQAGSTSNNIRGIGANGWATWTGASIIGNGITIGSAPATEILRSDNPTYDAATTYAIEDRVNLEGNIWVSQTNANTGNTPVRYSTSWKLASALPFVRNRDGDAALLITSPLSQGIAAGAQLRVNITMVFDQGITFRPNDLNAGGGRFNVQTSANSYVLQGAPPYLQQQEFVGGHDLDDGPITIQQRNFQMTFDGFDFGSRTKEDFTSIIQNNGTNGHWDVFKLIDYTVTKPLSIAESDAPIGGLQVTGKAGTFGEYRAWVRNVAVGDLSPSTRYEDDQEIHGVANFTSAGALDITQSGLVTNFQDTALYPNVDRVTNTNNRFVFESRPQTGIRIPYIFINDGTTTTVRQVDETVISYIQYPYTPYILEQDVTQLSFNHIQTVGLGKPTYIVEDNAETVNDLSFVSNVQETIERYYFNYLQDLRADSTTDTVTNSDLTQFVINSSTTNTLVYPGGNVEFPLSVPLQALVALNGTTIEIQRTANYAGSITASGATSNLSNTSGLLINWGTGSIDFNTLNSNNFSFEGSEITATVIGFGRFTETTVNGTMNISGQFTQNSIHNSATNTFDCSGEVIDSTINGIATITGNTATTVYNGTCNLASGTAGAGNTFNGNVMGAPLVLVDQTFGAVEIFPISGTLGIWNSNAFNGTTILLNENVDVRDWTNDGAVIFSSNTPQTITLTTVQMASGDYVLGTNVLFDVQDPPVLSTIRNITVPQDGRLYVEKLSDSSVVLGNVNGEVVVANVYSQDVLFDGTGDVLLGTDAVRVYYTTNDPSFAPVVYDTTLAELVIRNEARNALLFATSSVVTAPSLAIQGARLFATIDAGEDQTTGPDSQRYLLNCLSTAVFFSFLYEINDPIADANADAITNFIDAGPNGSTEILGDYVTLTSSGAGATQVDNAVQGTLANVADVDANAEFIANFGTGSIPVVEILTVGNLTDAQLQVQLRAETDKVIGNQEFLNVKLNGATLAVGAIPAAGDLPNTI